MFKKWAALVRKEGLWTLFVRLGIAGVGSQVLALVFYPVISRLYGPEDFGIRATFAALFMLILPFSTLNLEFALPLVKDRKEAGQVFNTSILVTVYLSLGLMVIVGFIYFSGLLDHPILPFLWLLPIAVFLGGYRKAALGWASWLAHRRAMVGSKYWRSGIKSLVELIGGFWNAQIWLLVGSQIGGILAMLIFIYGQMRSDLKDLFKSLPRTHWKTVLSQYKGYPIYTLPSTFADILNTHFPLLFFGAFLSLEFAGQFSMALLLIYLVFSSLGDAFSQAYLVALGKYIQQEEEDIRQFFLLNFGRISLTVAAITLGVAFLGEPVLLWILGPQWTTAASMLPILSLLIPVYFWNALCFHTLNKIGVQRWILIVHLLRVLVLVPLFFWWFEGPWSAPQLVNLYVGNSFVFSLFFIGLTDYFIVKSMKK